MTGATWRDISDTLGPRSSGKEDGLPPLLILLTILTGVVDALPISGSDTFSLRT
jgi:hypothetical protein